LFLGKTPHLAPRLRIDSVRASEYVTRVQSTIFTSDCHTIWKLADCGEILSQQNLALVLDVVVQKLEDVMSIGEGEIIAAPVDMINIVR
jgi:hypothetical protein